MVILCFENYEQFLTARLSILVTDCTSDNRLAIELAIVKAKAVAGETDLRWIDARFQIADSLTKHASGKSEAVLQIIQQEAVEKNCRRGHVENESGKFVTVLPTTKNCGLRANDQMVR